jgi:A/G-specific adenine glycosylase
MTQGQTGEFRENMLRMRGVAATEYRTMLLSLPLFRRKLLAWYDQNQRVLPWRRQRGSATPIDPYHILVSETMLQQTQVAAVIPYFHRFLARFPTLADLARADEQQVLRLWQGLGYYSRARNLRAAAMEIVRRHDGNVPKNCEQLLELPGIGRYTAGAIASIAFDRRAPILDGNVQRVLCRLDGIEADPRQRDVQKLLWLRAKEILPKSRVGDFNSALMELGAIVCTPRSPCCNVCPLHGGCQAAAAGLQEQIPQRKKSPATPLLRRHTYCIRRNDHWLIEQRPSSGRWAGMWQFITIAARANGDRARLPIRTTPPAAIGRITHALTHRRYEFEVFVCETRDGTDIQPPRKWATLRQLNRIPLSRPQLKIAELIRDRLRNHLDNTRVEVRKQSNNLRNQRREIVNVTRFGLADGASPGRSG